MSTETKVDILAMAEILLRLGFTISIINGQLFVDMLPTKE